VTKIDVPVTLFVVVLAVNEVAGVDDFVVPVIILDVSVEVAKLLELVIGLRVATVDELVMQFWLDLAEHSQILPSK
jgi:hypothetical protein